MPRRQKIAAGCLALLATLTAVMTAGPVLGAEGAWTPTSVRGGVIYLLDGKWQELSRGQLLEEATIRTLRSGRLGLEGQNLKIDVGPNSALQLAMTADGTAASIDQFLGVLDVAPAQGAVGGQMTLRAGKVTLTNIAGEVSISVTDSSTSVVVKSGSAAASSGGSRQTLGAGTYSTDSSGILVAEADGNGTAASAPDEHALEGAGNVGGNGNGANGNGGNANGNGGNANGNGSNSGNGGNGSNSGNGGNGSNSGNGGNANGNGGSNGNGHNK